MKRFILFFAAIIASSILWGYSAAIANDPPYDPNPTKTSATYDANATVDMKFKIVDEQGTPVANLCVNLDYASGRKGSYMPGDALTRSDGVVIRSAHPNATYTVYVTDRKMLDYESKTMRSQMKFTVTVKENVENKFKLIWKNPTPNELDIAAKNKVTFEFLDKNGKPVRDLWISMSPESDKNPEPRQIVVGMTDKDGRVYWTLPETGKFKMGAIRFTGDDWRLDKSQQYSFSVKDTGKKLSFTWDPE